MSLCIPRAASPVSEWSTMVLVEGALPGARVRIRIDAPGGPVVADSIVDGGRDHVALLGGVMLKAGQRLVLQQTLGGLAGPWTDFETAMVVGNVPSHHDHLPAPAYVSRLFEGSKRLWVDGTVHGMGQSNKHGI
jgi:hypothetical protein